MVQYQATGQLIELDAKSCRMTYHAEFIAEEGKADEVRGFLLGAYDLMFRGLEAAACRFIHSFDPCSYLYLSRSMDWFDATEGFTDLTAALAGIHLNSAYVIGVVTDILFPAYQQEEIAAALSANGIDTRFDNLNSIMGRAAFLVDYDLFNPLVAAYFECVWHKESHCTAVELKMLKSSRH